MKDGIKSHVVVHCHMLKEIEIQSNIMCNTLLGSNMLSTTATTATTTNLHLGRDCVHVTYTFTATSIVTVVKTSACTTNLVPLQLP